MTKVKHVAEKVLLQKRLGRHVEHDPRSKGYAFRAPAKVFQSMTHMVRIPVLDQGSLGSCTGCAAEACCGSLPFWDAIPNTVAAKPSQNAVKALAQAVALYSRATSLDSFYGEYPPEDTGSSGLAVAKAAQQAGLISGYLHTFTLEDALVALGNTPVIVGVNWYSGFDRPAKDGRVSVTGSVRGGHEFLLYGIDAEKKIVKARNSWGPKWGVNGTFYFSFDDLGRLLDEQGDCTIFVPLSKPAPTPSEASPDLVLAAAFDAWRKAKGL